MKLVVNNTHGRTAMAAACKLEEASSELAANILRVVAGAGSPNTLGHNAANFLKAFTELTAISGSQDYPFPPGAAVREGLQNFDWRKSDSRYRNGASDDDRRRWLERSGEAAIKRALDEVATWALRWRAAQISAQPTQESTSRGRLMRACAELEEARQYRIACLEKELAQS